MGRKPKAAIAFMLALAAALVFGGCAAGNKVETGEYSGTLVAAYQNQMVLAGDQGDMEFVTGDDTVYNMDQMCLDDIVAVKYHVDDTGNLVDEVNLVEHMETPLSFAGTLVDFDDDTLSLASKNLTVTFQIDSDSYIVGDLSKGDEIELTYLGDINEYPYANVVAVVTEVEPIKTYTVHGVVSELAEGTLLLSIDSAHAYRFVIADNTEVSGVADAVQIGDHAAITYEGSIKEQPNATKINIVKRPEKRRYIINGAVAGVTDNAVTLDTGKAKYAFTTTNSTKYYGEKPANGYKAQIIYTGDLNDKPEASIVYCVKDEKTAHKTATKQATKSDSKSSSAAAKDESKSSNKKSEAKQEEGNASQKAGEQSATTEGQKDESGKKDSQKADEPEAVTDVEEPEADEPEPEADEPEPQADEPEPQADELKRRGNEPKPTANEPEPVADEPEPVADEPEPVADEPEPEADEPEPTVNEPEPEADEPEPVANEPEPAADEPEPTAEEEEPVADEPEPEPDPEPEATEPEPEPEPKPEATKSESAKDIGVSGKGTIIKGNESKKTVIIEMKNGEKIILKFDDNTDIASGYTPQKGDVVKIEYGSSSMMLKNIQLVSRADDGKADGKADDDKADDDTADVGKADDSPADDDTADDDKD